MSSTTPAHKAAPTSDLRYALGAISVLFLMSKAHYIRVWTAGVQMHLFDSVLSVETSTYSLITFSDLHGCQRQILPLEQTLLSANLAYCRHKRSLASRSFPT